MNVTLDLTPDALEALAERVAQLLRTDTVPVPEPWLDVAGAATHLACKPQRVYDLASRRRTTGFPVHKDGSRSLFRASELDAWLTSQTEGHR